MKSTESKAFSKSTATLKHPFNTPRPCIPHDIISCSYRVRYVPILHICTLIRRNNVRKDFAHFSSERLRSNFCINICWSPVVDITLIFIFFCIRVMTACVQRGNLNTEPIDFQVKAKNVYRIQQVDRRYQGFCNCSSENRSASSSLDCLSM